MSELVTIVGVEVEFVAEAVADNAGVIDEAAHHVTLLPGGGFEDLGRFHRPPAGVGHFLPDHDAVLITEVVKEAFVDETAAPDAKDVVIGQGG